LLCKRLLLLPLLCKRLLLLMCKRLLLLLCKRLLLLLLLMCKRLLLLSKRLLLLCKRLLLLCKRLLLLCKRLLLLYMCRRIFRNFADSLHVFCRLFTEFLKAFCRLFADNLHAVQTFHRLIVIRTLQWINGLISVFFDGGSSLFFAQKFLQQLLLGKACYCC
jgi:hypothetical protein